MNVALSLDHVATLLKKRMSDHARKLRKMRLSATSPREAIEQALLISQAVAKESECKTCLMVILEEIALMARMAHEEEEELEDELEEELEDDEEAADEEVEDEVEVNAEDVEDVEVQDLDEGD